MALCSKWSPQRVATASILRFHGSNDIRRRRHGNGRFESVDASKSSFVALLSRGGADAAIYAREKDVEYDRIVQDQSMLECKSSSLSFAEEEGRRRSDGVFTPVNKADDNDNDEDGVRATKIMLTKEEYDEVDDHKRRLDDALVCAADAILRRLMSEGTTTSTMPKIDIVYVNNSVDGVVTNPTFSSEYVRNFVDVAINCIWDALYRKKMEIAHDGFLSSSSSSPPLSDPCPSSRYEIVVDITQSSAYERIRPTTPTSMEFRRKLNAMLATVISRAEESLMEMESEMDDCFLIQDEEEDMDEEAINRRSPPMPLFGDRVNAIIDNILPTFSSFVEQHTDGLSETEKELVNDERIGVLKQVLLGSTSGEEVCVQRLHNLHLQGLRDYFGRMYEVALTTSGGDDPVTSLDGVNARAQWKSRQRNAAREACEGFNSAASASIPQICQPPNGELCNDEKLTGVFSYVETLRGLLEDMQDATTALGFDDEEGLDNIDIVQGDAVDDYSQLQPTTKRMGLRQLLKSIKVKVGKRGPSRWYERLAAKVFVIGVNYIQGWVVLQTLRREASRRDLAMPKFPLF